MRRPAPGKSCMSPMRFQRKQSSRRDGRTETHIQQHIIIRFMDPPLLSRLSGCLMPTNPIDYMDYSMPSGFCKEAGLFFGCFSSRFLLEA